VASLITRHSRKCQLGPRTTAPDAPGCTCSPSYLTVVRRDKQYMRTPVGSDRKVAEKALSLLKVKVDADEFEAPSSVTFEKHAAEFLASLRRRPTTRDQYKVTLDYAGAVFGPKLVRKLTAADVTAMLVHVENENRKRHRTVTDGTLAKHLRTLSVCLEDARRKGRLAVNPVSRISPSAKPKARKGEPSSFDDEELRRLLADPGLRLREPYYFAARLAVTTGMRFGELAALRLSDVRLLEGELTLRRQFTAGQEVDTTKGGRPRIVDLEPEARRVLEEWLTLRGFDPGLVFERETGGHLDNAEARKILYAAMKAAGIARVGEQGGSRDWHSFRHTYARRALERGALIQWVQSQLGHSSSQLTTETYGKWSRAAQKREAENLVDTFTV